ncbi:hypothetical protein [Zavarzinella formosa]|uniref:hypothetical protein n=1 Tax=Zavarzinella formosa TaxID=360055 RepID=UPI0002EC5FCF|nr:hypothetical protein [Zavarzinella formosa]
MSEPADVRTVSRFEANLLRIARFILKQSPVEQAQRLIVDKIDRPRCLSGDCLHLLKDSLRKGSVLCLVRAGAWKRDRYLRDSTPKFGRLWERTVAERLALSFGKPTVELLMWLTATRAKEEKPFWRDDIRRHSIGDQYFGFLTYEALKLCDAELAASMRTSNVCLENSLIRLAYAGDFATGQALPVPSFKIWLEEPGIYLLEALQPFLENRWLEVERNKGQIGDWGTMAQQGLAQLQVLGAYLEAIEQAGRRDLGRFLLGTLSRLLSSGDMSASFWTGGLQGAGPPRLAERLETQRNALSVLRQTVRLRTWEQTARQSGYMDEDYAVSQFWLGEWERYQLGTVVERADRVLQQVEPLRIG